VAFGHCDRPVVGPYGRAERFSLIRINAMLVTVRFSVDVNFSANYLDVFAGEADDALDVILAPVLWKNKHDYVIAVGLADGDQRLTCERNFDTVYEFIDENMVSNQ
jgi:hypothetical protein